MPKKDDGLDFIFDDDLSTVDPLISELIEREEERQARQIILIPSESICCWPARRVLDTPFTNLYAEGYPPSENTKMSMEDLTDIPARLINYRRYGDRRFYKGNAYVNLIESLCRRRVAECFATKKTPADKIFSNVQPLSGAAANVAVFEAFVKRGETVMGMDLMQGGHLSHGSQFHMSGKHYHIVPYGVDPETERLDYEQVRQIALECKPKMIIAGYTSYPWAPDWVKFRAIADEVGAILMADIAHPAGMAVAGAYPNPIDCADVVTFTTHKTMFGPRAAIILTTNGKHAVRINNAVFPGEQGGPHMNTIAALAVTFKLAQSEAFKKLQFKIVENAKLLAAELANLGLRISYGGTDTHLLLIDLKPLGRRGGDFLYGEPAATILEQVGIILNKNTIPGDTMTPLATGLRLGTPWFTQRGAGEPEIKELARLIHRVLTNIEPFHYDSAARLQPRGKIDLAVMKEVSEDVIALTGKLRVEARETSGYPHFPLLDEPDAKRPCIRITGADAEAFLREICAAKLINVSETKPVTTLILDGDGKVIDEVALVKLPEADNPRFNGYVLKANPANLKPLLTWLRGLAEGYIKFEPADVTSKITGPVVIEQITSSSPEAKPLAKASTDASLAGRDAAELLDRVEMAKPYFVGQSALAARAPKNADKIDFRWLQPDSPPRRTMLYNEHYKLGARMVPFAGYQMPVRYGSTMEEHKAVRTTAGLFDVSHMGVFEVSGPQAVDFIDLVVTNHAAASEIGKAFYAFLLDANGAVIDDLLVYRLGADRFLMVVNAANESKDWTWLNLVNEGSVLLDRQVSTRGPLAPVRLRNLKEAKWEADCRVDLALQGPQSRDILLGLADKMETVRIRKMAHNDCIESKLSGIDVVLSRTGYTGEEMGFEIFVHPDHTPQLWNAILTVGQDRGVAAIGLGARDSLRVEAGLPLYGHELMGPHNISPGGAGMGNFVKLNKPFFVGKAAYLQSERTREREVVKFKVPVKASKPVKPGDVLVDHRGVFVGNVTSSAVDANGLQVGLAYVLLICTKIGSVGIFPLPQDQRPMITPKEMAPGKKLVVAVEAEII